MNSELQQVVNACIKLKEAGKKPSVGMIKSKLLSPQPIPIIIKGLSYWKDNQDTLRFEDIIDTPPSEKTTDSALAKRVSLLESEVLALRSELKKLTQGFEAQGFE